MSITIQAMIDDVAGRLPALETQANGLAHLAASGVNDDTRATLETLRGAYIETIELWTEGLSALRRMAERGYPEAPAATIAPNSYENLAAQRAQAEAAFALFAPNVRRPVVADVQAEA